MRVKFWGTRGSIPTPGPATVRYGGNTSCIEVESHRGTLVVIDCGTGGYPLGQSLTNGRKARRGHILISHTHWDHIQGIPFFAPLFAPGSEWDIYGPKGLSNSLREALAGQMQYTYFPVTIDQLGAKIRYHDLVEGSLQIDEIKVFAQYLNHTALTLGYRLEVDGVVVVYACDHEPHSPKLGTGEGEAVGPDLRHADFVAAADLLVHDAQYTAEEYRSRVGWGHSSIEYAVKLAEDAGVKRLALAHHDPLRDDEALDGLVFSTRARLAARSSPLEAFAATEGEEVDLAPAPAERAPGRASTEDKARAALADRSVILAVANAQIEASLTDALRAEGLETTLFSSVQEAQSLLRSRPSLAIVEHDPPRIDGLAICRAIREHAAAAQLSVLIVAAREDQPAAAAAGVTDWLIKPYSAAYARSKIRALLLRTPLRWVRAPLPAEEGRRLARIRALNLLDTAPEARFDRITRLAAAAFKAPMAAISVIDESRQWFKSSHGLDVRETARDAALCAHVVHERKPMVIADALADERFAENPLVIKDPRIRFYAGYPLTLEDGSCIGTLCVYDTRPRTLEEADLATLRDLAELATQEIRASSAHRDREPLRSGVSAGKRK